MCHTLYKYATLLCKCSVLSIYIFQSTTHPRNTVSQSVCEHAVAACSISSSSSSNNMCICKLNYVKCEVT